VSVGAFSFGDAKGVAESSAVELQLMEDSQCGTLHLFALLNCGRCYIYICTAAVAWYTPLPSEGLTVEAVWLLRPASPAARLRSCSVRVSRVLAAGSARSFCFVFCF
jgi:hypothetical protein